MGFSETRFHLVNDPLPTPLSCNVSYTNLTLCGPFKIRKSAGLLYPRIAEGLDIIVGEGDHNFCEVHLIMTKGFYFYQKPGS